MTTEIEAVYENGHLRPLSPLQLSEHQRVRLRLASEATISDDPLAAFIDYSYLAEVAREFPDLSNVLLHQELRAKLAHDTSCWADEIVAERNGESGA